MTQATPQLKETLFEMGDFPPVALLDFALKENNINGTTFIKDMIEYLGGDKGTNTNPYFLETIATWISKNENFTSLTKTTLQVTEQLNFLIEAKKIPENFLNHCIRFKVNPIYIIDWVAILSNTETNETRILDMEDAYYLTAVENKITPPSYRVFYNMKETLDIKNRLQYNNIKAYDNLQKRLHEEGQQFPSKEVFAVAELYSIEDIISLVQANYSLQDVLRFNKFGLINVTDILENGNNIPKEWLEVID